MCRERVHTFTQTGPVHQPLSAATRYQSCRPAVAGYAAKAERTDGFEAEGGAPAARGLDLWHHVKQNLPLVPKLRLWLPHRALHRAAFLGAKAVSAK